MTGKRRATLRRLRKALDPPGLGADSFRHILRFFGSDEQREALKLTAKVVDAHDRRTQREAARREARRTVKARALTAYLRGAETVDGAAASARLRKPPRRKSSSLRACWRSAESRPPLPAR
jgi:hypothetical protein